MLDVSLRLEILSLLEHLRKSRGLTMLFITHDMAAARQVTNKIAIMYLGRIVEFGDADSVIRHPIHPYSRLLVEATPRIQLNRKVIHEELGIGGNIDALTSAIHLPSGCRFHPRCKYAIDKCKITEPPLIERQPTQFAACDVVDVN
jgi:peptide/nickel transport system ATP-binding protein